MRIDDEHKQMQMEARDLNYILPAYVRSYQLHMKNEVPERIVIPMFVSVKAGGVDIPIEWVPPLDPIAVEIAKDGSNVAEVTDEQEAVLDEKDEKIRLLKEEVAILSQTGRGGEVLGGKEDTEASGNPKHEVNGGQAEEYESEHGDTPIRPKGSVSPAKAACKTDPNPANQPAPDRRPKQPPGGDLGAGQPPSDMQPRDRRDQSRTARDLQVEPEIEGKPEKPFEKDIKRGKDGKPIVEEKPDVQTQES